MVVMDKQDYIRKAKNLLEQPTYRFIPSDPTNKHKAKLMNMLKGIKGSQAWITTYIRLYLTGACSPQVL